MRNLFKVRLPLLVLVLVLGVLVTGSAIAAEPAVEAPAMNSFTTYMEAGDGCPMSGGHYGAAKSLSQLPTTQ